MNTSGSTIATLSDTFSSEKKKEQSFTASSGKEEGEMRKELRGVCGSVNTLLVDSQDFKREEENKESRCRVDIASSIEAVPSQSIKSLPLRRREDGKKGRNHGESVFSLDSLAGRSIISTPSGKEVNRSESRGLVDTNECLGSLADRSVTSALSKWNVKDKKGSQGRGDTRSSLDAVLKRFPALMPPMPTRTNVREKKNETLQRHETASSLDTESVRSSHTLTLARNERENKELRSRCDTGSTLKTVSGQSVLSRGSMVTEGEKKREKHSKTKSLESSNSIPKPLTDSILALIDATIRPLLLVLHARTDIPPGNENTKGFLTRNSGFKKSVSGILHPVIRCLRKLRDVLTGEEFQSIERAMKSVETDLKGIKMFREARRATDGIFSINHPKTSKSRKPNENMDEEEHALTKGVREKLKANVHKRRASYYFENTKQLIYEDIVYATSGLHSRRYLRHLKFTHIKSAGGFRTRLSEVTAGFEENLLDHQDFQTIDLTDAKVTLGGNFIRIQPATGDLVTLECLSAQGAEEWARVFGQVNTIMMSRRQRKKSFFMKSSFD
uniref:Uncharacterized protein n=1 Tax=Amorphochlora amoebiformis TaxID=1561963 RepID=A0A7S0D9B7_9EUKA